MTGVQTCALPISKVEVGWRRGGLARSMEMGPTRAGQRSTRPERALTFVSLLECSHEQEADCGRTCGAPEMGGGRRGHRESTDPVSAVPDPGVVGGVPTRAAQGIHDAAGLELHGHVQRRKRGQGGMKK